MTWKRLADFLTAADDFSTHDLTGRLGEYLVSKITEMSRHVRRMSGPDRRTP